MKRFLIFQIFFTFAFSESFFTKTDISLTTALEGKNVSLYMDVAMEGLALATPFIELGLAGFNQIENDKLTPLLASSLGVLLPIAVGKYVFKRERPQRHYRPRLWNTRWTSSFPSGHTATTAAWASIISMIHPRSTHWMIGYTLLTGYSQVYVGNHYISDIIAGWVLGYAVAFCTYELYNHNTNKSAVTPQLRIIIPLP